MSFQSAVSASALHSTSVAARSAYNSTVAGSNSIFRPQLARNIEEYDHRVRQATVYLYTRPVQGRNDVLIERQHWGLVFYFVNGSFRYVESCEFQGVLAAFYYMESPRDPGTYYDLGVTTTSPEIIRQIAVNNILNDRTYDFALNNCQNWIKQFARQLGDNTVLERLENYHTFYESNPVFAVILSSASGMSGSRSWTS